MTSQLRSIARAAILPYCPDEVRGDEIENNIYAFAVHESEKRNADFEGIYQAKISRTIRILATARKLEF